MTSAATIGFGTSGLRGHADGFTSQMVAAYVGAFLETACAGARERAVWIGTDLRASSPSIAAKVASAAAAAGWSPRFGGGVPTPALACYALSEGLPSIMVTGSHIPAQYNGLKFYRPDGELLKSDEKAMAGKALDASVPPEAATPFALPSPDPAVASAYARRYSQCFAPDALKGFRVGVFEHSAVGRDLIVSLLDALGAQSLSIGRSAEFVALDTEAVSAGHMALMREALEKEGLDAVVSTDGDGDRPLVLDEKGNQINGDVLGALTARALGADTIVTPLTSTSAIEMSGWFKGVIRTRIGSPYVVEAMAAAEGEKIAGFEANGGFLLGSPVQLDRAVLSPLATRDAMLPMLAVLAESARRKIPLAQLAAELPPRVMKAGRLKDIEGAQGHDLVAQLARSRDLRKELGSTLADPLAIDRQDGTRLTLAGGAIVHFRQSGNAPELRCYVETDSAGETDRLLAEMMDRLKSYLGVKGQ